MNRFCVPLLLALLIHLGGVAQTPSEGVCCGFRLPDIPASLTTPQLRADYLAVHYWDAFDFAGMTLPSAAEATEPIFVDFLTVLPIAGPDVRAQAIAMLLDKAQHGTKEMLAHFADLFEKYLWETASPLRNDELYICVLQQILASPYVSAEEKLRPRALLDIAQRNRPGTVAEDFAFTLSDGHPLRLAEVKGDYILLFFNSPDCPECLSAKSLLATSPVIRSIPTLTVVAIYPRGEESVWRSGRYPAGWLNGRDDAQIIDKQGLYDLRELPVIYLLDSARRVLLKHATVGEVENQLRK